MENYSYKGKREDVVKQLSAIMSIEDAIKFVINIKSFTDCLDIDEKIEIQERWPSHNFSSGYNAACILMDTNYFINLKATTIAFIALVLDITLTEGIASIICALTGIKIRAITRLSNDEKCIVKEALKNKSREFECTMFLLCRNNLKGCEYRCGKRCGMTELEMQKALDNLVSKNVFKIKRGK